MVEPPLNIPYGISSFALLRERNLHYVDKTQFIPRLEDATRGRFYLLFLRPRRFGKSTWLSVLEHYYDVNKASAFDALFGDLYIGQSPTPEKNSYLVFRLEFTSINPTGTLPQLIQEVLAKVRLAIKSFCAAYLSLIPELEELRQNLDREYTPAQLMLELLNIVERSSRRVYVLIDEYDNFTNALISMGKHDLYRAITHDSGFLREFYKALKEGTATGTIARMFLTGVSPVTMDDVTSGANMFSHISLEPDLNAMAGFTYDEVQTLVQKQLHDLHMTLDLQQVMQDLGWLYNGYRFSLDAHERVFNPDMILYFLKGLRPPNRYPVELIDHNVRMDITRLRSMLFDTQDQPRTQLMRRLQDIIEHGATRGSVHLSFPLDAAFREEYFLSLLYYLGMLSFPEGGPFKSGLVIPNYVVRVLFWETFQRLLLELSHVQLQSELDGFLYALAQDGDPAPFLEHVYPLMVQMLSNRDLIQLSEKNLKFLLLPFFMSTNILLPWSEVELNHGYSDLLLLPTQELDRSLSPILLELKFVKLSTETRSIRKDGVELVKTKALTKKQREAAVVRAFEEGEAQILRYQQDPRMEVLGKGRSWVTFTIVFEGLEAVYFRAPGGQLRKLLPQKKG